MKTLYKNMDNYVFAFGPSRADLAKKTACKIAESIMFIIISIPLALYSIWFIFN